MRLHTFIAAASLSLMTAGCSVFSTLGVISQPVSTISPAAQDAMNAAKKGLTAAHELHEAVADALTAAANSGYLTGTNASTAKAWIDQSEVLLVSADGLVSAADSSGIEAKVSAATSLISQVQNLIANKGA